MLNLTQIKNADAAAVRDLLSKLSMSAAVVANEWVPSATGEGGACRFGVWMGERLVGYVTWPSWTGSGPIAARMAVDESASQSRGVASVLLRKLLEQHHELAVVQLSIELPPGQTSIREAAWGLGFGGSTQARRLSKIAVRRAITPLNWQASRSQLLEIAQLKLPEQPPIFRAMDQQVVAVTPDGNRSHVSIESIETLLAPSIFCLPGRPAVITPVQRDYAELLLGHSAQGSLLPQSKAATHMERHYLSDPKTLKHFKRGAVIFFYESTRHGGAGAIVALARVRRAYLKPTDAISSPDLDPSVLDDKTLRKIGASKIKTVTTFDNVMVLHTPVPMSTLKRLGCGRPNDLISTRPITDAQMAAILDAGFASV